MKIVVVGHARLSWATENHLRHGFAVLDDTVMVDEATPLACIEAQAAGADLLVYSRSRGLLPDAVGLWRSTGKIGASEHATLPSEAEWERAARATDGRLFPWADDWREDCANTIEAGIGDTCAVGIFPNGRSEAGCLDMAGNVWEWTRSLWDKDFINPDFKYRYQPDDKKREDLDAGNDVRRVVRGGSWYDDRDFARCAYRYWYLPDSRYDNIGFRVVVRSPPVS